MCLGEHGEYACLPAEFVSIGDTLVIIGAGILGNLILQQSKICGAGRVIVVDKDNNRLEIAKKCGSDLTLNPDEGDLAQEIIKYNGILANVVIDGWHTASVISNLEIFTLRS